MDLREKAEELSDETNITDEMREIFNALSSGNYSNFLLMSATFSGKKTSVIAHYRVEDGIYRIFPVFAFLTDELMDLVKDDTGNTPSENGGIIDVLHTDVSEEFADTVVKELGAGNKPR